MVVVHGVFCRWEPVIDNECESLEEEDENTEEDEETEIEHLMKSVTSSFWPFVAALPCLAIFILRFDINIIHNYCKHNHVHTLTCS